MNKFNNGSVAYTVGDIERLRAENEAYKQLVDFIIAGNSLDDKDRLSAYEQLLKMASQAANRGMA